ncbi:hypothetical protein THASP1DRAFT_32072 [Thamnocephalis sphaerospora]|uniref:Metallo-beta-lactamase domain-containing protein n=1 Tax=Thamnocephalis sphaerospora TaxID=78915 RepID=A0A4P9XK27_9FUNG|nr:hypothetical protein THASP1DRAFT_32072 [Thamnocephalis sphaerospora]|eukprot:RKP06102.1 hypothetical protein THASP1DRAFT_32072 [Thamnocephalis sphaerospora]
MHLFEYPLCAGCGVQYDLMPADQSPPACLHCLTAFRAEDAAKQIARWTTLRNISIEDRRNIFETDVWTDPDTLTLSTQPALGTEKRAILLRTPLGSVLWDCMGYFDEATACSIEQRKHSQVSSDTPALVAIVLSHPRHQGSVMEWAQRLQVPIYVHADDQCWLQRSDSPWIHAWHGSTLTLLDGQITILRMPVVLASADQPLLAYSILHWERNESQSSLLLTGDAISVNRADGTLELFAREVESGCLDSKTYTEAVRCLWHLLEPLSFDRLLSAQPGGTLQQDAKHAVRQACSAVFVDARQPLHASS